MKTKFYDMYKIDEKYPIAWDDEGLIAIEAGDILMKLSLFTYRRN